MSLLKDRTVRTHEPPPEKALETERAELLLNVQAFQAVLKWTDEEAATTKKLLQLALVPILMHLFFELADTIDFDKASTFLSECWQLAELNSRCERWLRDLLTRKTRASLDDAPLYKAFSHGRQIVIALPQSRWDAFMSRLKATQRHLVDIFNLRARVLEPSPPELPAGALCLDVIYEESQQLHGHSLNFRVDVRSPPAAYGTEAPASSAAVESGKAAYSASNLIQKSGSPCHHRPQSKGRRPPHIMQSCQAR